MSSQITAGIPFCLKLRAWMKLALLAFFLTTLALNLPEATAQDNEARLRFGGRVGAVVQSSATAYDTCWSLNSKLCSGRSFDIASTRGEGETSFLLEGFALVRIWSQLTAGVVLSYNTSNTFSSNDSGLSYGYGADFAIGPTVEWTPKLSESLSLAFFVRASALVVMPGSDLSITLAEIKAECAADSASGSVDCSVDDSPEFDGQFTAGLGIRWRARNSGRTFRFDVMYQNQSARDLVSWSFSEKSKGIDWEVSLNQWDRFAVGVGIEY